MNIPGICLIHDFITIEEEKELLAAVDSRPWKSLAKRRVQHYGYEFCYERTSDLDTPELLDHLPALQQLLFRIIGCQPQGEAFQNNVIKLALTLVASESNRVHNAIKDGTMNLVDKYFEMKRHDAQKALDIYRRAVKQAERLSEFNELCTILDVGRGEKFPKIEQPPVEILQSMEEYVGEAPRTSIVHKELVCKPLFLKEKGPANIEK